MNEKDNPLRQLRETLHFSQAQLAKRCTRPNGNGVTPQVVLLNEMGVYSHCNPAILKFLSEHSGISEHLLSEQYDEWRVNEARYALSSARSLREICGDSFPHTPGHFHFEDVRNWSKFKHQFSGSTVGFCKIVKLQPSLVTAFESSNFRSNSAIIEWLEVNSGVAHVD